MKKNIYRSVAVFTAGMMMFSGMSIVSGAEIESASEISLKADEKKIKALDVDQTYKNVYFYGEDIDRESLKITAEYEDGTSEEISDYDIKGYNKNHVGTQKIYVEKSGVKLPLTISVKNRAIKELKIVSLPVKTVYYTNDPFSSEGLTVYVKYDDGSEETLHDKQLNFVYENSAFKDGDELKNSGSKSVFVYANKIPGVDFTSLSASFSIEVKKDTPKLLTFKELPVKINYCLHEKLDLTGIRPLIEYTDGSKAITDTKNFIISGFDPSKTGKQTITFKYKYAPSVSASFDINLREKQPKGLIVTDYPKTTVNVGDNFDDSSMKVALEYDNGDIEPITQFKVDTSEFDSSVPGKTSVLITDSEGQYEPLKLFISVREPYESKWRKAIFGQSANPDKEESGSAGVKAEEYGSVKGKVNVRAWDATGKITADHDGIVYYYTKVDTSDNFEISTDITINKYLEHNNDDTKRNGQEGFGIMARDAVPFTDESGELTIDYNNAAKDSEGIPITREQSSVFASNTVCVGGFSGTGWPNDPTSANYEKNTKLNRINLFGRTGVTAIDGGGKKMGPYALSSDFPKEGNKYRITLKKVNGGFSSSCFNYATKETMYADMYDADCLAVQDKDCMYVGFFASRWADIDFENTDFQITDKETSPKIENKEKKLEIPSFEILSQPYSATKNYDLVLRPTNVTGTAVVNVNNKTVVQDVEINGDTTIPLTIKENYFNDVAVIFTPDDKLSLTDYSKIAARMTVANIDFNNSETVYVSPDGTPTANGTYESPYDVDTAIGFLAPGQTIILKEGIYKRTKPLEIAIGNDGTPDALKVLKAEEGKKVVFDLQNICAGAVVTGNYWKIRGIEFKNSGENLKCFHLGGSNCKIESCIFHDNADMGLQISRTYSTDDRSKWPSNNIIEHCESYNNCDPSKINADGFGAKLTVGEGNIFRNCLSHHNVDDGWDLYTKVNSGAIGAVTLENCVSYRNGYKLLEDGSEEAYGAGGHNGFKCGGENVGVNHKLINCIAFGNDSNGVTTNSNPMLTLDNVVSFDNNNSNIRLYSDKPAEYNYSLKNVFTNNCREDESDYVGGINRDADYVNHSEVPAVSPLNYIQWDVGVESVNSMGDVMTASKIRDIAKKIIEDNGINLTLK